MTKTATASFKITSWNEEPCQEIEGGAKLTRATVTQAYKGAIEGEGTVEYLMMYRADGSAKFVGAERVVGTVDGRAGSLVLQHDGSYEGGVAKSDWTIVSGAGAGDLAGLTGSGRFAAGHEGQAEVTFEYEGV